MIKVTTQNGTEYQFPEADTWQVVGVALAIYAGNSKIAELSSFLMVEKIGPAPEPEA